MVERTAISSCEPLFVALRVLLNIPFEPGDRLDPLLAHIVFINGLNVSLQF